jgi:hypothetical protein
MTIKNLIKSGKWTATLKMGKKSITNSAPEYPGLLSEYLNGDKHTKGWGLFYEKA